ncbi:MAG: protocatechuate 3,4-dioxygenase, alpha subunit [Actinomycetota bacterium]|jgi:protocatechuate 3,4-dioxygenase alpha subunit|nr:protocatechuate 3,4-dioxygenase, alpha subunit [Actinomycetota bacterium]
MTSQSAERLGLTPSQTIGPFLHIGLMWDDAPDVVPNDTTGAIWLRGHLYDGAGAPISDAMVETWQADPEGAFDHPDDPRSTARSHPFRAFGRCATGPDGEWAIHTLKPGSVPASNGATQAPHVDVSVFARGLLDRVVTRLYFDDEAEANASDPVLSTVPEHRRGTLTATRVEDGYRLDIRLQGKDETVFFDL